MSRTIWISLAVAVVLIGAGVGLGLTLSGSSAGTSGSQSQLVDSIMSSPDSYYGRHVRVRDTVNHIYSDHALTLGEGTQQGLLVVVASSRAQKFPSTNAYVLVTGVVQRFGLRAWHTWTGSRSDPSGILAYYDGQPAIRAARIRRLH